MTLSVEVVEHEVTSDYFVLCFKVSLAQTAELFVGVEVPYLAYVDFFVGLIDDDTFFYLVFPELADDDGFLVVVFVQHPISVGLPELDLALVLQDILHSEELLFDLNFV